MTAPQPFSLRIFVADGDPDGLRLVDRSNWIGRAVVFPRALYPKVRHRPEFDQTGVYLLLGPRTDSDGDLLYIGEGDPVGPRLEGHYAKRDFWTRAIFFVAGPGHLNKAHVQFLEAQLIRRALSAKRTPLDNANIPGEPSLSEADRADMEVFLRNMLGMLPVMGIQSFEQAAATIEQPGQPLLVCQGKGVTAHGLDTPQGFVVRTGSFAVREETLSLKTELTNVCELRASLLQSGVLVPDEPGLRFTQDYTFNSPSLASSVVLARSSNGRIEWRDAAGRTLKQLQEAESK